MRLKMAKPMACASAARLDHRLASPAKNLRGMRHSAGNRRGAGRLSRVRPKIRTLFGQGVSDLEVLARGLFAVPASAHSLNLVMKDAEIAGFDAGARRPAALDPKSTPQQLANGCGSTGYSLLVPEV